MLSLIYSLTPAPSAPAQSSNRLAPPYFSAPIAAVRSADWFSFALPAPHAAGRSAVRLGVVAQGGPPVHGTSFPLFCVGVTLIWIGAPDRHSSATLNWVALESPGRRKARKLSLSAWETSVLRQHHGSMPPARGCGDVVTQGPVPQPRTTPISTIRAGEAWSPTQFTFSGQFLINRPGMWSPICS